MNNFNDFANSYKEEPLDTLKYFLISWEEYDDYELQKCFSFIKKQKLTYIEYLKQYKNIDLNIVFKDIIFDENISYNDLDLEFKIENNGYIISKKKNSYTINIFDNNENLIFQNNRDELDFYKKSILTLENYLNIKNFSNKQLAELVLDTAYIIQKEGYLTIESWFLRNENKNFLYGYHDLYFNTGEKKLLSQYLKNIYIVEKNKLLQKQKLINQGIELLLNGESPRIVFKLLNSITGNKYTENEEIRAYGKEYKKIVELENNYSDKNIILFFEVTLQYARCCGGLKLKHYAKYIKNPQIKYAFENIDTILKTKQIENFNKKYTKKALKELKVKFKILQEFNNSNIDKEYHYIDLKQNLENIFLESLNNNFKNINNTIFKAIKKYNSTNPIELSQKEINSLLSSIDTDEIDVNSSGNGKILTQKEIEEMLFWVKN